MQSHPDPACAQATFTERRRHPRVNGPFRARVRGVNARGEEFVADAEVKNLCGGGLYAMLAEHVACGASLTAELFLTDVASHSLTLTGAVLRVEALIDCRCGAAVAFEDKHFLA